MSGYLSDLRARHELVQDLKIFKMGLLGIPQERIAQRLGLPRTTIEEHLTKSSELKKSANDQLKHGFSSNTIAEKLGWPEPLVWAVALEKKAYQGAGRGLYPGDKWPGGKAGVFFIARY